MANHADYMRAWRLQQKAKKPSVGRQLATQRLSDAALEAAILKRGRELTAMMRTPLCMWPNDWITTND